MKFLLLFVILLVITPSSIYANDIHKSNQRALTRVPIEVVIYEESESEYIIGQVVQTSTGPYVYNRSLIVEATAYSPRQPNLSNYAATGIRVTHGIIAVDPRYIPLGTRLYIPGYGHALAADTGGAIRGYKIDLAFETVAEAWAFGRQHILVYILE